MLRRVGTMFSLLLLVATGILWVQSYRYITQFPFTRRGVRWEIASSKGVVRLDNHPQIEFDATQYREADLADIRMAGEIYDRSVELRQKARSAGELSSNDRNELKRAAAAASKIAWQRLKDVDNRSRERVTRAEVGCWIPWPVLSLPTLLLPIQWMFVRVRRHRRMRSRRCVKCGYDLRASGDRCPECGSEANFGK